MSPRFKNTLLACIAVSFWFKTTIPSLLLFGEYEYPSEEAYAQDSSSK